MEAKPENSLKQMKLQTYKTNKMIKNNSDLEFKYI